MSPSVVRRKSPSAVVELLRLLAVVFFAGIGFELGNSLSDSDLAILGPLNGVAIGVIVGSGVGYVMGGVLGRTTVTTVDRTALSLREVSVESLVSGIIGLLVGVIGAAAVGLPLFLIPDTFISVPLYTLLIVVIGMLGFRVGQYKRGEMLGLFGARAGMAPRQLATSLRPRLVDSSVAIDGRILDVVRAGFLHGTMVVCAPVLAELQGLADAADDTRRSRGRRGLEALESLRREPGVEIEVWDDDVPSVAEVDAKLVRLCIDKEAALLTLDTNLAKAAALAGVRVLNMHALTLALRPVVQAGDDVSVLLIKPGKETGQAVGYLDDGTMVVAENSRSKVGSETTVRVTSVLTTANGRMVFASPLTNPGTLAPTPERLAGNRRESST
ncbi:MAG TPA: hypothetical protein VNA14_04485 [Mycobacteriales bacterium]|nr:hypothetical protein [Mycobacteriales bacterium]